MEPSRSVRFQADLDAKEVRLGQHQQQRAHHHAKPPPDGTTEPKRGSHHTDVGPHDLEATPSVFFPPSHADAPSAQPEWLGAFERVLGEHGADGFATAPAANARRRSVGGMASLGGGVGAAEARGDRSAARSMSSDSVEQRRDTAQLQVGQQSSLDASTTTLQSASDRAQSAALPHAAGNKVVRHRRSASTELSSGSADPDRTHQGLGADVRQVAPGHTSKVTNLGSTSERIKDSGAGPSQLSIWQTDTTTATTGSGADAQTNPTSRCLPGLDAACSEGSFPSRGDAHSATSLERSGGSRRAGGACLVRTDLERVVFEDLYLNHAPGMQPLKVTNLSEHERVLVRIESDLGRGALFLRRKRTMQEGSRYDGVVWPANTVAWAREDGLAPHRLRELRHMTANLEPADSFILEPSSWCDLFVSLRPIHFATESDSRGHVGNASHPIAVPRSPTLEAPPPALPQGHGMPPISPPRQTSHADSTSDAPSFHGTRSPGHASLSTAASSTEALPLVGTSSPQATLDVGGRRADAGTMIFRAFDVSGTVTVRAWRLASVIQEDGSASLAPQMGSAGQSVPPTAATSAEPETLQLGLHIASDASNLSSASSSLSHPASLYSSTPSSEPPSSAPTSDAGMQSAQVIKLPLTAHVCRPQIALWPPQATSSSTNASAPTAPAGIPSAPPSGKPRTHGLVTLDFGDIFVGRRDERQLTLFNASEIECLWQARLEDADNMLSVCPVSLPGIASFNATPDQPHAAESSAPMPTDAKQHVFAQQRKHPASALEQERSHALDHARAQPTHAHPALRPNVLAPLAAQPLRFVFAPTEPCKDYEQVITVTNLHNTSNSVRVLVRANILGRARDDALLVLSGDSLDFGDCCGGHWTKQLLVLKNVGDTVLDLAFSTQPGYETTFQLAELAPQPDDEPATQEAPPALLEAPSPTRGAGAAGSRPGSESGASTGADGSTGGSVMGTALSSRDASRSASPSPSPSPSHSLSLSTGGSLPTRGAGLLHAHRASNATAVESARTPTSHAQATPAGGEPPFFDLGSDRAGGSVSPLAESNLSAMLGGTDDEDEFEVSSVASNAGSLSDSPTRSRPGSSMFSAASIDPSDSRIRNSSFGSAAAAGASVAEGSSADAPQGSLLTPVPAGGLRHSATIRAAGEARSLISPLPNGRPHLLQRQAASSVGESSRAGLGEGSRMGDSASARSEMTTYSQESRIAAFPASSAGSASAGAAGSASGAGAGGSNTGASGRQAPRYSRGHGAALLGLRSVERGQANQLEELALKPGNEYRIVVSYRPTKGELDASFSAGRLVEQNFRISLDFARARAGGSRSRGGRERRTLLCRARTCTSFITVTPQHIDLGETNVGTRKTASITVTNHSELTARVDVRYVSKVLSMYRDEVAIPALQKVELRLDFFPRRINEAYRKQITVANLLNRLNDQIFEVRSVNVDRQRVSFHSLFYRLLTPTGANFVDFGDVNVNSARVRTFSIENTSPRALALEVSAAHPEDLKLYVKRAAEESSAPADTAATAAGPGEGGSLSERRTGAGSGFPSTALSSRYTEIEASDAVLSSGAAAGSAPSSKFSKLGGASGSDLKERFLETLSTESPASIRNENASWRLAQKRSHFRGKEASRSTAAAAGARGGTATAHAEAKMSATAGASKGVGEAAKAKPQKSLATLLKKGSKGRPTMSWGRCLTLRDRTLLGDLEYLDLACGPPVDFKRIPAKSRRYQLLEQLETGSKPKLAAVQPGRQADRAGHGTAGHHRGQGGGTATAASEAATTGSGGKAGQAKKSKAPAAGATHSGRSAPRSSAAVTSPAREGIVSGRPRGSPSQEQGRSSRKAATSAAGPTRTNAASSAAAAATSATPFGAAAEAATSGEGRSPALTAKRRGLAPLSNPSNVSKLSTDELVAALEGLSSSLSTFYLSNPEAEERSVRAEINLQRELMSAIASGRLVPVDVVTMAPHEERQIVAVLMPSGSTRPHIQGNARKQDSRIFLRLVDFDSSIVRASPEFAPMADLDRDELPVRDLIVRSTVCRSLLEIGQPHINFGHMEKGETKTRRILVQNRSEWALRYCIRKSGSIASGDIKIRSGVYGVVSGHGKREVEFDFSPSLSGPFQERLTIENVADREADQVVYLKAHVHKTPNFAVEPALLLFGEVAAGRPSDEESIVLTNLTNKPRTFVVAVDPHELRRQRSIVDVMLRTASEAVRGGLSRDEEEEVERISQKLKIATRKGQQDKVEKYTARLEELGVKPASAAPSSAPAGVDGGGAAEGSAAPSSSAPAAPSAQQPTSSTGKLKRFASSVTMVLEGGQSKRMLLRLRASTVSTALDAHHAAASDSTAATAPTTTGAATSAAAAAAAPPIPPPPPNPAAAAHSAAAVEEVVLRVQVHELKNRDETRTVELRARVRLDADADADAGMVAGATAAGSMATAVVAEGAHAEARSTAAQNGGRAGDGADAGDSVIFTTQTE